MFFFEGFFGISWQNLNITYPGKLAYHELEHTKFAWFYNYKKNVGLYNKPEESDRGFFEGIKPGGQLTIAYRLLPGIRGQYYDTKIYWEEPPADRDEVILLIVQKDPLDPSFLSRLRTMAGQPVLISQRFRIPRRLALGIVRRIYENLRGKVDELKNEIESLKAGAKGISPSSLLWSQLISGKRNDRDNSEQFQKFESFERVLNRKRGKLNQLKENLFSVGIEGRPALSESLLHHEKTPLRQVLSEIEKNLTYTSDHFNAAQSSYKIGEADTQEMIEWIAESKRYFNENPYHYAKQFLKKWARGQIREKKRQLRWVFLQDDRRESLIKELDNFKKWVRRR